MQSWSYTNPRTPLTRNHSQNSSSHWDYSEHPRNNYVPTIVSKADMSHIDPIEMANTQREITNMLRNYLGIGGS